jgi:hypothetical protein
MGHYVRRWTEDGEPALYRGIDPNKDQSYYLAFVNGNPMTDILGHPLPGTTPGQQVDISLPLMAPLEPGTYFGDWRFQNAAGHFFGEIVFLRIVVPPPQAEAEGQSSFDPVAWRDTIWAITSVFESGSPEGDAAAFQVLDAGIISYGKHQATLASGSLHLVLQAYFQRSDTATSRALQQEYADRIGQRDESLRHDDRLRRLLLEAAAEPAMHEAQDAVFAKRFYQPAVDQARRHRVRSPLGLACLYDTAVQGGLLDVLAAVTERLGGVVGETSSAGTIDEATWLNIFLDERQKRLRRLADRFATAGDRVNAEALQISTFRVVELRNLLQAGNLALTGKLNIRGQEIPGIK